jgi:hypothetical protein
MTKEYIEKLIELADELEQLVKSDVSDPVVVSSKFRYLISFIRSSSHNLKP